MSRARRRIVLLALPLALILGVAAAIPYYTSTGSGSATASVGGLTAPTISSATGGIGSVALSWSTVSPPTGGAVAYYVSRDGGAAGGSCPAAASPTSVTSCTDSGLAAGTTYHYTVTAVWRSWTATSAVTTANTTARTITLTASTGYVGDTVSISGQAFPANAAASATYNGAPVTLSPATSTDGNGSFSGATFVVPASPSGGNTVVATAGGQTASATFTVNPRITVSPTSGASGSTDTISGTGFAASSALSATFNTTSGLMLAGTTSTDAVGSFGGATYTVPPIGSGTYTVRASDASADSATALYTIKGTTISRTSAAWNLASTWIGSAKTGTITTSTSLTIVTGSGTRFTTELQAGDAVYLGDGTTLVGTVSSIQSDTSLTLQANAASTNAGVAYTGSRVPTSLDAVTIDVGNAVTIPAGYAAFAQSLSIGPAAPLGSQSLALLASTSSLTVSGNVDVMQPSNANNTQLIVDAGTATIGGNLDLNSTAPNANKCDRVRLTSGTVTVSGDVNVNDPNQNGVPSCNTNGGFGSPGAITQIDMSGGAGTLNIAGALNVAFPAVQAAGLASAATSTIVFNGTSAQTIPVPASGKWAYGAVTVTNTSAGGVSFGAGSVAGDFTGDLTIGAGVTLAAGGYSEVFSGNLTNNGAFSAGTGSVTFAGTTPETIDGSSSTAFNDLRINGTNTVTLARSATVAGNLAVSSGTLDLATFTLNRTSTGGTLSVSNGATLAIGGTNTFPASYSTHTLGASSTVNYEGVAQTVTTETYGNLLLSGSGTKTMPSGALAITGTLTTSGTVNATAQAAVTVGSDVTVGNGTTFTTGAFTDSIAGNFTNNGTFTATGSTVVLNGTGAEAIDGSSTTSFNNLTLSNSTTAVSAATDLDISGTFTLSTGAVFTPAAAVVINSAGAAGTITGSGNAQVTRTAATADFVSQYKFSTYTMANLVVEYSASATQTISSTVTYGGLTLSGSGTKTAAAGLTVTGDLTIASGVTFAASSFNHSFAGNFTDNGTFTSTGTVTLNGTGAQSVGGSTTTAFNTLTVNKSSGTATLAADATVAAKLTVAAGTLDLSTFTLDRASAGGTLTVSAGATLRLSGVGNFPANYSTRTLAATSTVEYYASSAQTISAATYGNLLLTGSAAKTAGGALTVKGNLTIGSGATFAGSTFAHSVAGDWSNSGTFTAGTSKITFNGSSGQTLTGATTFNNLTLNDAAGLTLQDQETVGGTLALTSGVVATGANTLIVSTGGTVNRTSGYVNGTEQRGFTTGAGKSATFDVGTASTYSPISVASLGVTTGGTLTASSAAAQQPNYATSGLSQSQYVTRYWTLTPGGGLVVSGYNATGTFVAGDLVGSPTTANLALSRYSGGTWTEPTSWSATSTTATGAGFGTGFGDFAAGIPVPTQLVFTTQPVGVVPGLAFTTQPQVSVEDALGHVIPSDSSTVTLSITSGTPTSGGPGTLSGCSQSETNGVITFFGCKISAFGAGYQLHAVDGSLTAADSSAFDASMAVSSVAFVKDTANVTTDATSSFSLQPNAVYVVHVFRHSSAGDSVTGISTSGFVGASALTAVAPTGAVPTTGQNWNSSDYQWAWYLTTGASPSGTGTVTVNFTKGLGAGQVTVIDVTQILGANTSSPLAQASNAATANSTTATGNLGSAVVSTFDTKLVLFGQQANTTPSSLNLANLFVSKQNAGTGATLWDTNPLIQNDNITVTNGQWATLTLEIAHA